MASALMHMNLTQLKNDGVIGMDRDQSYDRDAFESTFTAELGQGKRDHDDDLDRCQVKKRRKQSKPIRIASTESLSDDNDAKARSDKSSNEYTCKENPPQNGDNCGKNDSGGYTSNEENGNEPFFPETEVKKESSFPLNLSHTKSPSPKDSFESIPVSSYDERNWYKPPDSVTSSLYPMPQLDPSSLKSQVYPYNLLLSTQNPGLVPPNFKRIFVGNNENSIGSPHRIFNPEAFCDLCNKEFCNKYFLKTHKANKHGIYTDNIPPNNMETLPTLPIITYFSNSLSNLSIPSAQNNKKALSGLTNNANKTNSSSMRAFCNICQREFCNKYFVRRHKAKIHGIIENAEETSQEYKPSMMSDKTEDSGLPGPSSGKSVLESQSNSMIPRDMHDSIFEDDKCKIIKEPELDSELSNSPQNGLNFLVSSWPSDDMKETSKSPDRTKRVPSSSNSAFCDICCKEYCNKYFLRVHKQKCHGITTPEREEKPKEIATDGSENTWKANQPMPLNLILRESNQNVNENEKMFTCNQCDMSFPEDYLLKMHYNLIHNIKIPDSQPQGMNSVSFTPNDQPKSCNESSVQKISSEVFPKAYHHNEVTEDKLFSLDVQRLHSMIMKLNQPNQLDSYVCEVCNKDFGRSSSLENHIIKEHSTLLEEIGNGFYDDNQSAPMPPNKWDCPKCSSSFQNPALLDIHLTEKHNIFEPKLGKNGDESMDMGSHLSINAERSVLNTPTSSFCEICKKELCNKYFMKTHMQRMHGISIENGAHIGGVVCDICNKELCSKYFLRVHKQNSHGIVEEAFLPQIGNEIKGQTPIPDTALKPTDNELSNRYYSHFTEVCTICSRRFRSVKWLKTHLLNDHGDEGKEKWKELQQQNVSSKTEKLGIDPMKKNDTYNCCPLLTNPMGSDVKPNEPSTSFQHCEGITSALNKNPPAKTYQCSYCSFNTTVLALLFIHERSHFSNSTEGQDFRIPIGLSPKEALETPDDQLSATNHSNHCFSRDEASNFNYYPGPFEKDGLNDDNNFSEVKDDKRNRVGDSGMRCSKCPYTAQCLDGFLEHLKKDHKSEESETYLQIVRDALIHLATTSLVPASFARPSNTENNFTMQPFVVEDKNNSMFVSSVVFLPVKQKLNAPVTASFRLTPT